jgi:hypothetical protein
MFTIRPPVSNLDLVITIDGLIAHLSGALNAPTWVMVDSNPYWGWGRYDKETIWYRSARIYRQKRMHRWDEVFAQIRSDLIADRHRQGEAYGSRHGEKPAKIPAIKKSATLFPPKKLAAKKKKK